MTEGRLARWTAVLLEWAGRTGADPRDTPGDGAAEAGRGGAERRHPAADRALERSVGRGGEPRRRMESHGQSGAIQIIRGTYELIEDAFDCRSQIPIMVKGEGYTEVWHVTGRRASA
jgi:hypothetical protein